MVAAAAVYRCNLRIHLLVLAIDGPWCPNSLCNEVARAAWADELLRGVCPIFEKWVIVEPWFLDQMLVGLAIVGEG